MAVRPVYGLSLCSYCGCRDATDEIDGLAICAECLREMEGER